MAIQSLSLGLILITSIEGNLSWLDYPGFEVWRFVNLIIFVGAALYLHHRFGKPIAQALRMRRERIKVELENARKARAEAQRRMAEVESRLKNMETEIAKLRALAASEAEAERARILRSTEIEMEKLREQGGREIASATKAAQVELRRFAASQSVKLAETLIRRDMNEADDARIIRMNIEELGGSRN